MKHITTLHTNGRKFEIVLVDFSTGDMYCAVEDKYIDKDGRLNTPMYAHEVHAEKTVEKCIEMTKISCDVDELVATGIDAAVASIMVVGHVSFEQATEMWNKALAKEAAQ